MTTIFDSNLRIMFPDKARNIVKELLEKYELKQCREEVIERMRRATTLGGKAELFECLPIRQIFTAVKQMAINKIIPKELYIDLEKGLKLSPQETEELVDDLKNKVLVLIEKTSFIKEEMAHIEPEDKTSIPAPKLSKKPSPPIKQDTYRETIE